MVNDKTKPHTVGLSQFNRLPISSHGHRFHIPEVTHTRVQPCDSLGGRF